MTSKSKPASESSAVKNKVLSDPERRAIAEAAMERAYKPAILKAVEARNKTLWSLLREVYDGKALSALSRTPRSLLHTRRAVEYQPFGRHYGGHRIDVVQMGKRDSEFLYSGTLAGVPESLPNDALPCAITVTHEQREAVRLAKEFVARCKEIDALEEQAKEARKQITNALYSLKRSRTAAEALPEIADIIADKVGRPPQALVPSEQVAKVRALLKVAA